MEGGNILNAKELIEVLSTFDPECNVLITDQEYKEIDAVAQYYGLPEIIISVGEHNYSYEDRSFEAYLNSPEYTEFTERTKKEAIERARETLKHFGVGLED